MNDQLMLTHDCQTFIESELKRLDGSIMSVEARADVNAIVRSVCLFGYIAGKVEGINHTKQYWRGHEQVKSK